MFTLSRDGQLMIGLLGFLIVIFITESLPIGAVVGIVYGWVVFFGILSPEKIAPLFSSDAAWFLVGALMMAEVVIKYNIHKRILLFILKIVGSRVSYLVVGLVTFCAISAAFIASHMITAMMLPIVLVVASTVTGGIEENPQLTKLLLFSICFGANIGSLGSPSGGGRNIVMLNLINKIGGVNLGYGQWVLMCLPITLILIPITSYFLLLRWKPKKKSLDKSIERIREEIAMREMSISEWIVSGIFLFILYLWLFHSNLGIGMISLFGAVLFLIFDLAEWEDYQKINWNIPMLFFGAIGLGTALAKVGAAKYLAARLLSAAGEIIPMSAKALVMFQSTVMSLFSQIMANGPTAATLGPVLMESSNLLNINPVSLGVALAVSTAFAYLFVIGTPPNAIIYGSGYVDAKDFITTGIFMYIISMIVLWLMISFWWPFLGVEIGKAGIGGFL